MKIFYANPYNNWAIENDDHTDTDHFYDTVVRGLKPKLQTVQFNLICAF